MSYIRTWWSHHLQEYGTAISGTQNGYYGNTGRLATRPGILWFTALYFNNTSK